MVNIQTFTRKGKKILYEDSEMESRIEKYPLPQMKLNEYGIMMKFCYKIVQQPGQNHCGLLDYSVV